MGVALSRRNGNLRELFRPIYNRLRSLLIFETNNDYENTIVLSSGGRTGSTWVSEIIKSGAAYRYLFEPFTLYRLLVTPRYEALLPGKADGVVEYNAHHHLQDRPAIDARLLYIRPDTQDSDLRRRAEYVLSGRFHHPEVDQYNYTSRVLFAKRFIKETSSNLWIAWLQKQFPAVKIAMLMRHPIPTIYSRTAGKDSSTSDDRKRYYRKLVLGQPDLVQDFLWPFADVLQAAETEFQQRLAVWCIQNYVPLRQFAPEQIYVAFYEKFCQDPLSEIPKLFAFYGRRADEDTVSKIVRNIGKPSSTYHERQKNPQAIKGGRQIGGWIKRATKEQLRQTDEMLRAFGLNDIYSSSDPMPNDLAVRNRMSANST